MKRDRALEILRREKPRLMKKYGLTSMVLFGSVARDEAESVSDVDVFVEMPLVRAFDVFHLAEELEQSLGVHVDVVRKHSRMRPLFLKRLEREGILV